MKSPNTGKRLGISARPPAYAYDPAKDCQRQFKTDPLIGNIANLKLTYPWHLGVG